MNNIFISKELINIAGKKVKKLIRRDKMNKVKMNKKHGFTLIDFLVVVAIIILTSIIALIAGDNKQEYIDFKGSDWKNVKVGERITGYVTVSNGNIVAIDFSGN